MIKFYNDQWFSISFSDIQKPSRTKIAGQEFYECFYQAFFNKYDSFEDIDSSWREQKLAVGDFIVSCLPAGKILSVGAGLGFVENYIHGEFGNSIELHVTDFSDVSNKWLRKTLPQERIHKEDTGDGFDLIYICNVEYSLTDIEFISMLESLNSKLNRGGQILIISSTYLSNRFWGLFSHKVKNSLKHILEILNIKKTKSQFWGFLRHPDHFKKIFDAAGLSVSSSGMFGSLYYVKARN
jgi:hypothetical protein